MSSGRGRIASHPARPVVAAFVALIAAGAGVLMTPLATDGGRGLGAEDALFLATSATTVTGLVPIDVGELSAAGEVVLLVLVQLGGFGIMTAGSVIALLLSRRIGLRQRMLAQTEIGAIDLGDLRRLVGSIAKITLAVEGALAAALFARLWQRDEPGGVAGAAWSAVFHSISSFNNAGLSLYSDGLVRLGDDPVVVGLISFGLIVGGLGFPVHVELLRRLRRRAAAHRGAALAWTLHLKVVLVVSAVLLTVGPAAVLVLEWTNPDTLGGLGLGDKFLAGWFQGVTPRTAGFNTVDYGALRETTLLVTILLMFVGAGPASTAGGIKVTTAVVPAVVIWSQMRGDRDLTLLRRRLPEVLVRQALTIISLATALVGLATLSLMASNDLGLTDALFEATSAFGTVGLSTGVTGAIDTFGHAVLILTMFVGRLGPLTIATALALRSRPRLYRHAQEAPVLG